MIYALIFIIIVLILDIIVNKIPKPEIESAKDIDLSSLYQKKIYLLTQNELKFYKLLKSITDKNNLNLFSQVSLYEVINAKDIKSFNKIKSKTIDFVITDTNCRVKLCIELDDSTHIRENRQKRDEFVDKLFNTLDIKLIRIPVQNFYNLNDLEQKVKESCF